MVEATNGQATSTTGGSYRDDDAFTSLPFFTEYDQIRTSSSFVLAKAEAAQDRLDKYTAQKILTPDASYEPGGEYFTLASDMFGQEAVSPQTESDAFELGVTIGQDIVANAKNAKDLFLGYLHAVYSLDVMKIGMVGHEADNAQNAQEYGVIEYLKATVLDKLEATEANIKVLQTYIDSLSNLARSDVFYGWIYVKAESFLNDFGNIANIRSLASRMEVSDDTSDRIDGMTDRLTAVAMEQRKYGIKSSYTESSLGGSWIFYEAEDFMAAAKQSDWDPEVFPQVAQVFHTAKTSFNSLRVDAEVVDVGNGGKQSRVGGHLDQIDMHLYIGKSGEIAFDADGLYTLDFILRDMPKQKQALRAEIIGKFFDLTMPVQGKKRLPSGHVVAPESEDKERDPILKFLVPRLKRLDEKMVPGSDVKREVRQHGVVWHIRELPEGFHPSPEARQRAERLGLKLADNETFVKAHTRGNGYPVQGHQAVKRLLENVVER